MTADQAQSLGTLAAAFVIGLLGFAATLLSNRRHVRQSEAKVEAKVTTAVAQVDQKFAARQQELELRRAEEDVKTRGVIREYAERMETSNSELRRINDAQVKQNHDLIDANTDLKKKLELTEEAHGKAIQELQGTVAGLKEDITRLTTDNVELKRQRDELDGLYKGEKEKNGRLEHQVGDLQQEVDRLSRRVSELEKPSTDKLNPSTPDAPAPDKPDEKKE